jgi:hypothetical protein
MLSFLSFYDIYQHSPLYQHFRTQATRFSGEMARPHRLTEARLRLAEADATAHAAVAAAAQVPSLPEPRANPALVAEVAALTIQLWWRKYQGWKRRAVSPFVFVNAIPRTDLDRRPQSLEFPPLLHCLSHSNPKGCLLLS